MIKRIIRGLCRRIIPRIFSYIQLVRSHNAELKALDGFRHMTEEDIRSKITELYENRTGHKLSLDHPKRFTEKIQWRKAFDRSPIYSKLSDKYAVRAWVAEKIGEEYLIPLLGVWESEKDIDFKHLPHQFVLKTNNGSATNTIVTNKSRINKRIIRENYRFWLQYPYGYLSMEFHYNIIKPLIIAEKFMSEEGKTDLVDYKFFCFSGVPTYCQLITGRNSCECIDFYDMEWNHQEYIGLNLNCSNSKCGNPKPKNFDEMIRCAKILSNGFAFVRVDFYEINGKVYFGEMTFTPGSGFGAFKPDEWDFKLGQLWDTDRPQIDNSLVQCEVQ